MCFILGPKIVWPSRPEVGAVCLNWTRTDLCGGGRAIGIPIAIADSLSAPQRRSTGSGASHLRGDYRFVTSLSGFGKKAAPTFIDSEPGRTDGLAPRRQVAPRKQPKEEGMSTLVRSRSGPLSNEHLSRSGSCLTRPGTRLLSGVDKSLPRKRWFGDGGGAFACFSCRFVASRIWSALAVTEPNANGPSPMPAPRPPPRKTLAPRMATRVRLPTRLLQRGTQFLPVDALSHQHRIQTGDQRKGRCRLCARSRKKTQNVSGIAGFALPQRSAQGLRRHARSAMHVPILDDDNNGAMEQS